MFQANNMIEIGGLAATAINIIQSQSIHENEAAHAKKRHEESMALAQMQHEKDLKIAKQTYLMAAFTSLEQHFQQLNADLISSSKESESDMFDQRNQSFQTVILSASVMFSSLSTVIIQGLRSFLDNNPSYLIIALHPFLFITLRFLPTNADEFLFVSYALTTALSFAFLFLSIVLCIEVILRASSFMYNRARKHTTQLREAIQKTKLMMKRIRGGQFPDEHSMEHGGDLDGTRRRKSTPLSNMSDKGDHSNAAFFPSDNNDKEGDEKIKDRTRIPEHKHKNKSKTFRRQIAEMKEEDLQVEWERHEAEVHKYLEEREKINDQTSVLVSADANSSRMSFEQFWRESCKFWADIAILFFYAGTANLLLAIMIYMWAEFFITYQSPVGAVIAVVFIGVSLVVGILLAIYLRQNDTYSKGIKLKKRPLRISETEQDRNEEVEVERDRDRDWDVSNSSVGPDDINLFYGEEKQDFYPSASQLRGSSSNVRHHSTSPSLRPTDLTLSGSSNASTSASTSAGSEDLWTRRRGLREERDVSGGDAYGSFWNTSEVLRSNDLHEVNASNTSALTTIVQQSSMSLPRRSVALPDTPPRTPLDPISKTGHR